MKYYTYLHTRLDTNEVFYVGIGKSKNYKRAYSKYNRNKYWKNIINVTKYKIEIVFESDSYDEVKQKEIELIKFYGRKDLGLGKLCNLTDGGEGTVNYKHSKETINKCIEKIANKVIRLIDNKLYKSVNEAARENNLYPIHLRHRLNLFDKSIGFEYVNVELQQKAEINKNRLLLEQNYRNIKNIKKSSKCLGVSWDKEKQKWVSQIRIDGKKVFLGRYIEEQDACQAYQNKLNEIKRSIIESHTEKTKEDLKQIREV